jgi:hypothetical protein
MTRANTEQIKHTPWFAKAGAACSIVPIARFVGPNIFALKGGGYAVTSHSAQGLTASRVLVHIDTDSAQSLINNRLAYVSISRASDDARVYTNNSKALGERLASDINKTSAVDVFQPHFVSPSQKTASDLRVGISKSEVHVDGLGIGI